MGAKGELCPFHSLSMKIGGREDEKARGQGKSEHVLDSLSLWHLPALPVILSQGRFYIIVQHTTLVP